MEKGEVDVRERQSVSAKGGRKLVIYLSENSPEAGIDQSHVEVMVVWRKGTVKGDECLEDVEVIVVGGGLVAESCGSKEVYLVWPFYKSFDAEILEGRDI